MIFHEECVINLEYCLFKANEAIIIGWAKGDVDLSLVLDGEILSSALLSSERPDVAEHFGVQLAECLGFAIYTADLQAANRGRAYLRLYDKKSKSKVDISLEELGDYDSGMRVIDGLKLSGLPSDFFQDGVFIEGVKYRIGSHSDRRTAVGHIEVTKIAKGGKGLLLIGWAVSKSPNNLILKIGDLYFPYDSFFYYPRPDIEEAFSKTFGQNARKAGLMAFYPNISVKSETVQLYYCKRNSKSLHLIASNEKYENEIPFEDIQNYLLGIHTPELTLFDRVKKIDGPLALTALKSAEDSAYYIRPEILIHEIKVEPAIVFNIIVPKGLAGDVLQGIMSFIALGLWDKSLVINYFFCDVVADGGHLVEIANRTHSLFGCQVAVFNGCTNLLLGHIGYGMGKFPDAQCFLLDARSGFEYQQLKNMDHDFMERLDPDELRVFYARDVNGVSGTTLSFEALDKYVDDGSEKGLGYRKPFSPNKVFGFSMNAKTMNSLCSDMGFVPLRELTDLEFLIRRSDQLSSQYELKRSEVGLPFARTHATPAVFHASLGRQIELYTMAQIGV